MNKQLSYITMLILALFLGNSAVAQDQVLDSLYEALAAADTEQEKLTLQLEISDELMFNIPDSALTHAKEALDLAVLLADSNNIAEAYNDIGVVAALQGKHLTGLENFQSALSYYEAAGDLEGASKIINNLGVIYGALEQYSDAIKNYEESYKLSLQIGDTEGAALNLYNISIDYMLLEDYEMATVYADSLDKFQLIHGEFVDIAPIRGEIFLEFEQLDSAEHYLEIALAASRKLKDELQSVSSEISLAEVHRQKGNFNQALDFLKAAERSAKQNEFNDAMLDVYAVRSDIFKDLSDFRHAYKYQELHVELKDSLKAINNFNRMSELNARYESEKREKEIAEKEAMLAEQEASEKSQRMIFMIVVISIVVILGLVSYSLIKKKKINYVLNEQNEEIREQRRKILSSINYAKKIQNSILLPEEQIQKFLPNSFVYFKPKDIVSGDFYWFSRLGSRYIIATIDCTGHGVPGAFMSLIANSKLNKVVNEKGIHDPGRILTEVHKEIITSLNQEEQKNNAQDGMDMSLCIIDPANKKIQFAGAQNPIYLVKDQKAREIKGDGFSIGGSFFVNHTSSDFTTKEITYEEGTYLYMFTDGYIDQFGGEDNKKMNKKRFKDLLLHTSHNGLTNAKHHFENTFHQWRGLNQQIDDVLIIGTKL